MSNRKIEEAWRYHNSTKHPGMPPHYMDWENQPIPFKIYTNLDPTKIPTDLPFSDVPTLKSLTYETKDIKENIIPDLKTLGRLLFLSAGITKKRKYPGGEFHFRAAACTGALYHIDLYIVTMDLDGLDAGVYHFGPHDFSLRRLRIGDYRGTIISATAQESLISTAPIIIICTSTFWRNSWKYQSRAYRHAFWDSGTILANLLAASSAYHIPSKIFVGFKDESVNGLLGLDTMREVAVSIVSIGKTDTDASADELDIEKINYETMQLSKEDIDYPSIRRMHEASSLITDDEVREWRETKIIDSRIDAAGKLFPLKINDKTDLEQDSETLEKTILKRGSTRQFDRVPITFGQLSKIIYSSTQGIPADFLNPFGTTINDIYLIVNDVEGIPKGSYFYRHRDQSLELLKEGDFRREAGHLGLGQDIPAEASVDVFFLTDLDNILDKFGNRGYRAVELEAGMIGGKLYLAAYSLGLGASGLTFFDDEVTRFFSPHAKGKSVMFLVALGRSVKRKQSR